MARELRAATTKALIVIQNDFMRCGLPGHMWDGVERYVSLGYIPGDFLKAIFENSLMRAAHHADHINGGLLYEWASFVYTSLPGSCHGTVEKVRDWHEHGGMDKRPP